MHRHTQTKNTRAHEKTQFKSSYLPKKKKHEGLFSIDFKVLSINQDSLKNKVKIMCLKKGKAKNF